MKSKCKSIENSYIICYNMDNKKCALCGFFIYQNVIRGADFMQTKRFFNRLLFLVAALVVLVTAIPVQAFAVEMGDVVVVGSNDDFGISKPGAEYYGAAIEYLTNIQKRTGHRYTYSEGTTDEIFRMFKEKIIDVIPFVTKEEAEYFCALNSIELGKDALLTCHSLIPKYHAVYVYDGGAEINFYDTEQLNKSTIGYLEENSSYYFPDGSFVCSEFEDAEFIPYATEIQMQTDLISGKLDAVVKSCLRPWENETIVYQFGTGDTFFLVSGSNAEVADKLDEAVGGITTTDPYFVGDVYERNLSRYGSQKYAYTLAEKNYLIENPVLRIAYNTRSDMTEFYDRNTGTLIGVSGTMLMEIENYTGLSLEITAFNSLSECVKALEKGEVDAICGGVNYTSMANYGSYFVSAPYSHVPVVVAGNPSTLPTQYQKIAVPYYGDDITSFMKRQYPNASFLPYENVKSCLDAVMRGEADVVCSSAYEVVYLKNDDYEDIAILDVSVMEHVECIALKQDSVVLSKILGKALAQISYNDAIVYTYDSMTGYGYDRMTLSRFVEKYLWLIILVGAIITGCILALVTMLVLHNRRTETVDPLTGGRTKQKYLDDTLRLVKKSSPEKWAMVLFDIDKFKYVNDRLGYDEGNKMLERLAKTVSDNLDDGEIFSRISDDNFACTIKNVSDAEITTKINNIFSEFDRRNQLFVKYPVLFSAGVCRLGQCAERSGAVDLNVALDRCKIAKKTLKNSHVSSVAFYDGKIRDKALREKDYENAMPAALKQREFMCYLQPKYGLRSRHIEGAEALIRWNSKEFGFVYPDEFIPLSEKNGFVVELDFFILEEVCAAMRRWIDSGKKPVVVSVNQSRLHLNYDDYIWRLREIVDKYEIPYEYIELELTESVFIENADKLLAIMHKLHEIGFKLSLDDFGSGYSSLNMLKDIPVDVVKIDREFFNGTVNSSKGRAIISTVVDLAKNLDMEVISEGVETVEQVDFLAEINCAMVQGYYFAKPMPMSTFEEMWEKDLEARQAERDAAVAKQAERYAAHERAEARRLAKEQAASQADAHDSSAEPSEEEAVIFESAVNVEVQNNTNQPQT